MASIMTNFIEQEFKAFLKEAIKTILDENIQNKSQVPEILDVVQAAAFLHFKVNTLYEKTHRRLIPHFKKGGKLYFHRSELEVWIKDGKVKTHEEIEREAISFTHRNK